jgi:hypothetical protein
VGTSCVACRSERRVQGSSYWHVSFPASTAAALRGCTSEREVTLLHCAVRLAALGTGGQSGPCGLVFCPCPVLFAPQVPIAGAVMAQLRPGDRQTRALAIERAGSRVPVPVAPVEVFSQFSSPDGRSPMPWQCACRFIDIIGLVSCVSGGKWQTS